MPKRPDPFPSKAFQCRVDERERQLCSELAQARLSSGSRPLSLELKECRLGLSGGFVRWASPTDPREEHQVLVKFDRQRLAERFVPNEFRHFQTQWPCPDCGFSEELTISLPLADTCLRRGVAGEPPVRVSDFVVEPNGAANCPSGLSWYGRDRWCERNLEPETAHYHVKAWWAFTPMTEGHIAVRPRSISWRARLSSKHPWQENRIEELDQVVRVRDQLAELWTMAPEVPGESCRDGSLRLVEAQRAQEWRVVLRFCADPARVARLLESWIS